MYCCDLLLNLDGLTCTVMGYAEGKVSHFVHAVSDNIYRGGSRGRVQGVHTPT